MLVFIPEAGCNDVVHDVGVVGSLGGDQLEGAFESQWCFVEVLPGVLDPAVGSKVAPSFEVQFPEWFAGA